METTTGILARRKTICILLILVAASARLALAIYLPARMTWPDGMRYDGVAKSLLVGKGFGRAYDPPMHTLLLTGVYATFGPSVRAARLVWAIVGTLTCWVCFRITSEVFGQVSGLIALALVAVYPLTLYLSVLPEYPQGLFSLLLALTVLAAVRIARGSTNWRLHCCLGVLAACAILTNAAAIVFGVAIGVWLLVRRPRSWRRGVTDVAVAGCTCLALVVIWTGYHAATTGYFFWVSANGGVNLYKGNCALMARFHDADAADFLIESRVPPDARQAYEDQATVMREARSILDLRTRDEFFKRMAFDWIRDHPSAAARLFIYKFFRFWAPFPRLVADNADDQSTFTPRNLLAAGTYLPILALATVSVVFWKGRWHLIAPVLIAICSVWAVYTLSHPSVRYRAQIDYFLIVLAAESLRAIIFGRFARKAEAEISHE